jgi:outer membrane protein assembly factor BamB
VLAGDVLLVGVSTGDVLLAALDPATGASRWNYTPAK